MLSQEGGFRRLDKVVRSFREEHLPESVKVAIQTQREQRETRLRWARLEDELRSAKATLEERALRVLHDAEIAFVTRELAGSPGY